MDEQSVTTGDDFDYPSDDADKTWHMHDDGSWGWDIRCPVCYTPRVVKPYPGPYFSIRHLKAQNAVGMTVREWEKDIIGDKDPDEIQRV